MSKPAIGSAYHSLKKLRGDSAILIPCPLILHPNRGGGREKQLTFIATTRFNLGLNKFQQFIKSTFYGAVLPHYIQFKTVGNK